ncbi:MAG: low affinity iron permease family protein [Bacteroidia bacterium]
MCVAVFHYSENWQMVINSRTTIITFLMVFSIQKAHCKDSLLHDFTSNRLADVENMTEEKILHEAK